MVVSQITDYVLIREADAIAVEYGYMRNLHNEFEIPVTVLFVGVGFSEAQAFVVEYSKVCDCYCYHYRITMRSYVMSIRMLFLQVLLMILYIR